MCREGDDAIKIPSRTKYNNMTKSMNTPLYYKWVVPIILPLVTLKPGVDYEALWNAIRPYANDGSITNPILQ